MSVAKYEPLVLEQFDTVLGSTSTELSSVALDGRIVSCSDEWFAPASDLLKVGPAPSLKGQFGPKGALFDGWETRRHNPTYDWAIIRLGPAAGGSIVGFDVDTANFNGNEAPEVEIYALRMTMEEERQNSQLRADDARWNALLPRVPCQPSSRHLYSAKESDDSAKAVYTHVKLHMIPDGGIARFRVYGTIAPPPLGLGINEFATSSEESTAFNALDLAHVLNGGRVVYTSDQHFGVGPNVLLPGRGKDMGDGWETRRSRSRNHKDWLIIKLGEAGFLNYAEIDTHHFLGNFPESVELHGISYDGLLPPKDAEWTQILDRVKTGPGKQHYFSLINVQEKSYSHVKVTMHPDGGIKRVRIVGRRSAPLSQHKGPLPTVPLPEKGLPTLPSRTLNGFTNALGSFFGATSPALSSPKGHLGARNVTTKTPSQTIKAQPLTPSAFANYGDVICYTDDKPSRSVNQGTAQKIEQLSDMSSLYPPAAQAKPSIHLYHCKGVNDASVGVKVLERHQYTKQAFIPLAKRLADQRGYLVIVAKTGPDDLPDLTTLAAFMASSEQGIAYGVGIWHHPMIALGSEATDFACVVYESTLEDNLNCDEVFYDREVAKIDL